MTPGIDYERLDEYSRVAVPLILSRFPDWEQYAETENDGSVCFKVRSPNPSMTPETGVLRIWTENHELTVGYGEHHTHFNPYTDEFSPEMVAAGLDYVVDVLTDRMGVVCLYTADELKMSSSLELPLETWPPRLGMWAVTGVDRVTLRTWFGDGDREWTADRPGERGASAP